MEVPELRPLNVGETLDVSIKLYLNNAWTLIKLVSIIVVPMTILGLLVNLSTVPDGAFIDDGRLTMPDDDFNAFLGGALLAALIAGLGALLATGAAFKAVGDAYLGRTPDARSSLAFASGRLHSLLWVTILEFLTILVGLILLIVPGIYAMVAFSVAVPALLIEDLRGTGALARSRALVRGRWWPVLAILLIGTLILPGLIGGVIQFAFGILLLTTVDSVTANLTIAAIGDAIAGILTTPLQVAVIAVLYFDLRVRKEGFDLQLLAQRIGSDRPTPAGPASSEVPPAPGIGP